MFDASIRSEEIKIAVTATDGGQPWNIATKVAIRAELERTEAFREAMQRGMHAIVSMHEQRMEAWDNE